MNRDPAFTPQQPALPGGAVTPPAKNPSAEINPAALVELELDVQILLEFGRDLELVAAILKRHGVDSGPEAMKRLQERANGVLWDVVMPKLMAQLPPPSRDRNASDANPGVCTKGKDQANA